MFKIAAAQFAPVYLNKEATVEKACSIIADAGKLDIDLLVFPEAFLPGYPAWVWHMPAGKTKDLRPPIRPAPCQFSDRTWP